MPRLRIRAATEADLEITYAITEDAMRSYVEETWGTWNAEEQRQKHRANFSPQTHSIILVDGQVGGFMAEEEFPSQIWLVKLYISGKFRGHGIGSEVLQGVLHRARAKGKPVTLRVLKVNKRAQALYAKHGFRVTEETPERLFMAAGA